MAYSHIQTYIPTETHSSAHRQAWGQTHDHNCVPACSVNMFKVCDLSVKPSMVSGGAPDFAWQKTVHPLALGLGEPSEGAL